MKVKSRVFVLYTGGTIGMTPSDPENPESPLRPAGKEDLIKHVPRLGEKEGIHWEIAPPLDESGKEMDPVDSSDVNASHWIHMARAIEKVYNDYDGFVILHGTDTMAYTASGLSFMLANLAKPVVITGSQLPISSVRTDAVQNFVNAMNIAGYKATGLPCIPEVVISFGDRILRGCRTTKVSTSGWNGFDTPNCPHLGSIGEHIRIREDLIREAADNEAAPFYVNTTLDMNVMDAGLFPGLKASALDAVLNLPDLHGIVLRTFGAGNAPGQKDFLEVIDRTVKGIGAEGKVILNITQCTEGMVEMGLYAASSGLLERGVISGLDMTAEAALAKLMWILAAEVGEEIQTQLQIDQRGEQSQSLFDMRYGPVGKESEPTELVKATERPSGQFRKSQLSRAVLRISGVGFTDTEVGESVELRAYINLPGANSETSESDPHFAATFKQVYEGSDSTTLIQDVTATVKRVVEEGRPININLIPLGGKKIWYNGLYLALFTKS